MQSSTPTNLTTTVRNQQVSLRFVALSGDISNYAALTGGILINDIAINNHVITGLSNTTTYYFVVTAVKNSTESTSSN